MTAMLQKIVSIDQTIFSKCVATLGILINQLGTIQRFN